MRGNRAGEVSFPVSSLITRDALCAINLALVTIKHELLITQCVCDEALYENMAKL